MRNTVSFITKMLRTLSVLAVLLFSYAAPVWADSAMDAVLYPWYSTTLSFGCQPGTTTGDLEGEDAVVDYAGNAILTEGQLQLIYENQAIYEQAATEAGIPWQMLAVIHKIESGLKKENPNNGQGVYQFVDKHGGPYDPGSITDEEFLKQTKLAAEFIKSKAALNYPGNRNITTNGTGIEAIRDTFYSYNGRAEAYATQAKQLGYNPDSQAYEGSPYVMNKADIRRDPTVNPTTWGQIKVDGGPIEYPANNGHGAFVIYGAIAGIGTNCVLLSGGSLAWPMASTKGITSCFGPRVIFGKTDLHEGLDMDGGDGAPVLASEGGTVAFAGSAVGYGPHYVVIQHEGMATGYGHMSSKSVSVGDKVKQGQPIGTQGNEGRSTGSHLHFNLIPGDFSKKQTNVNPLQNGLVIPAGVANPYNCR